MKSTKSNIFPIQNLGVQPTMHRRGIDNHPTHTQSSTLYYRPNLSGIFHPFFAVSFSTAVVHKVLRQVGPTKQVRRHTYRVYRRYLGCTTWNESLQSSVECVVIFTSNAEKDATQPFLDVLRVFVPDQTENGTYVFYC